MAVTVPNPEERGRRCVVGRDAIYAFRRKKVATKRKNGKHGAIVGVKGLPLYKYPGVFKHQLE